jgi:hypothetical protein
VKEKQLTDGKMWEDENVKKTEEILGASEISPFGTNDKELFEQRLGSMPRVDMQQLAYRVGVNPHLPVPSLKSALARKFEFYSSKSPRKEVPPVKEFDLSDIPNSLKTYLRS